MTRSIRNATIAALTLASFATLPRAWAQSTAGTHIYSPTPQLYRPFTVTMHMTPKAMRVIHADLHKMHRITCTLTGGSMGNDMAEFHCRPG
jgi:hypothetical protein